MTAGSPHHRDGRPLPLDRALRALRRHADDRARRDGRERRAAVDPGRPRLLAGSSLAWVVNAYLIAFGGLLLLAGRLGDLIGRRERLPRRPRRLHRRLARRAALAQSQEMLVAARFVQGVGGAMTSAVILGMIVTMFPEPREQAKAIGVYAFVASAGGSIGLLAGGVLTQAINWHWIFFVNIPIGIATARAGARACSQHDRGHRLRPRAPTCPGAVLITGALMLGVYTIVKPAAEDGWGSGRTLASAPSRSRCSPRSSPARRRRGSPLMPLRIFRSRNVAGANADPGARVAGMFGMFFLGALYLQRVLGYDAARRSASRSCRSTLVMGTLSLRYSERLITRFGARSDAASRASS